jgi:hypothetical protein
MNSSDPTGIVRKERKQQQQTKEEPVTQGSGPLRKSDPTEREEKKRSKRSPREKQPPTAAERSMMEWRAATKDRWTSNDESPPVSPRGQPPPTASLSGGGGGGASSTGVYNGYVLPRGKVLSLSDTSYTPPSFMSSARSSPSRCYVVSCLSVCWGET